MEKNQMLTEETIARDAKLVARLKAAKPASKPMGQDEFKAWLASLR